MWSVQFYKLTRSVFQVRFQISFVLSLPRPKPRPKHWNPVSEHRPNTRYYCTDNTLQWTGHRKFLVTSWCLQYYGVSSMYVWVRFQYWILQPQIYPLHTVYWPTVRPLWIKNQDCAVLWIGQWLLVTREVAAAGLDRLDYINTAASKCKMHKKETFVKRIFHTVQFTLQSYVVVKNKNWKKLEKFHEITIQKHPLPLRRCSPWSVLFVMCHRPVSLSWSRGVATPSFFEVKYAFIQITFFFGVKTLLFLV